VKRKVGAYRDRVRESGERELVEKRGR